jgi:hypothetical protein
VTNDASWQTSNAAVITVSASGLVRAVAGGEADVRAIYQSVAGSGHLTIMPVRTPGANTCTVGSSIQASCGTATALCNDNTYSCSQNRSGTCSSHDGVQCWFCPGALCSGLTAPFSIETKP